MKIKNIVKRDGSVQPFNSQKIISAISKAGTATNEFGSLVAQEIYDQQVLPVLESFETPTIDIEKVQDIVEKALFDTGFEETYKAFAIYRHERKKAREKQKAIVDVESSINEYVNQDDWRVKANANQGYSLGGMILNVSGKVVANYWLSTIYPKEVGLAHRNGDFHIHDLDMLSGYCCGHSLRSLLTEGFNGVPNKVSSNPPKHLSSALSQAVNFLGTLQNEWAGAQAFSSFDTYLAPFIKIDNLSYDEVKQKIQEFIFNLNVPSRWGCVPTSTEVLTTEGWKNCYSLKNTDLVYSMSMSGELRLSNVKRVIHKNNKPGVLYKFKNAHYGYTQIVTPDHRVLLGRTQNSKLDDLEIKYANEIVDEIVHLPSAFRKVELPLLEALTPAVSDEEVMFASALYCDGSWYYKTENGQPRVHYIKSPRRQPDSWFENLCNKLNFRFSKIVKHSEMSENVNQYSFYGESARKITELVGRKNRIDEKFLNLNKRQSELFLDTWAKHDGQEEKLLLQFDCETICKGLQHIAINAGKTSYIRKIRNTNYVKFRQIDMVAVKDFEVEKYTGEVWCPSVTWGTVIFRDKDGCVFVSGNCQSPFTNLTFDIHCPDDLRDQHPIIGGEEVDFTYGELQKEMDMINRAYIEVMTEGDAQGRVFTFPIPTYNITDDFDWDSENSKLLFEMTAKYGLPYFQNFMNSDLDPHMIRSMCPLGPDTEIRVRFKGYKKGDYDRIPIKSLAGDNEPFQVLYKNEWVDAKLVDSGMQYTKKLTFSNAETVVMSCLHLQPVVKRNGKLETVYCNGLKVGDKVPFDYGVETITKIEAGSYEHVYCLAVDNDSHLFSLANGLITHNCRLRLDLTELLHRGNGLFGSAEQTGSVGVVTINCARLGYLYKHDWEGLLKRFDYLCNLAKTSLELKRETITRLMREGLYPYTQRYLGSFKNFFSTIGVNGINEMLRNFSDDEYDITTVIGHERAVELLQHLNKCIQQYQAETGNLYNSEATPAEGTATRFAREDRKRFPDIIQAGADGERYYTNSSQLPVGFTDDPFEALDHQEDLQRLYLGGTVLHLYMGERVSTWKAARDIVRKTFSHYQLPYITITPTFSICPKHGYIAGAHEFCPKCDAELVARKRREKKRNAK